MGDEFEPATPPDDPNTERERDVGPPMGGEPRMIDLVGVFRGLRRIFGGE